jgi:GntR family transcriptional regulator, transcriptional repressor for pyruvate dehydrogenase complex
MDEVAAPVEAFAPVRGRRAFDEIIDQLRSRLRTGDLRPGDRLPSERSLAEQFQVSRNTVREALRMLEISGLIQIRRGATGGGFVSQSEPRVVARGLSDALLLSTFSLSDLTEVRHWLGLVVTRLACERATEEDLQRLEANVEQAEHFTRTEEWERRSVVNHEFLDLLAAATANPVLEIFQHSVTEVIREIVSAIGPIPGEALLESRRRLLAHLRARDAEGAAAEMDRHLEWVHATWLGEVTTDPTPLVTETTAVQTRAD